MTTSIANTTVSSGELFSQQGGKLTAPAFLDLADSAARQSSNLPDINMQRLEQRRAEFERQRQHTRKAFEDQMRKMDQLQIEEERKLLSLTPDPSGHQHVALSAPTTPPRNVGSLDTSVGTQTFNALVSPIILTNGQRNGITGTARQDTSGYRPGLGLGNIVGGFNADAPAQDSARQPMAGAKSMPGSRRGSKNKDDPDFLTLAGLSIQDRTPSAQSQRDQASDAGKMSNAHSVMSPVFNDKFLLDDELDKEMLASVAQYPDGDDKFPILVRRDSYPGRLSVASAALDLAPLSQAPQRNFGEIGSKTSEWPQFSGPTRQETNGAITRMDRGRAVTQPQLNMKNGATDGRSSIPSLSPGGPQQLSPVDSRRSSPPGPRDGANQIKPLSSSRSVPGTPLVPLPGNGGLAVQRPSVSPSSGLPSDVPSQILQAQAQMYGLPELAAAYQRGSLPNSSYPGSTLSFGSITQSNSISSGYGNNAYAATGLSAPYDFDNEPQMYGARYNLGGRAMPGEQGKMNGLHGPKHKRGGDLDLNRFAGTRLEDLVGEIPSLCKDQHGCRYLQKKLEEGIPEHRDMIFRETFGHFADLMTDPFGNYLCQKLLEFATDEQRNLICESVALDLVGISLNMHGTRAVQKMIDYLSTPRQIHAIIIALSMNVVTLIKDLNGNHVIQKCLNRLVPEDNQFIYNAVAAHCVEVATHRHGCCVLQRCIDHASDAQRMQLVNEITYNALTLVQDPYGNYVVQYILDLNDNRFSDGVIRQFVGNVIPLSMQKFSSNVIEKCIRVAEPGTRKLLVEEFLNRSKLEKLLRDSFGNYCVQTALDYADPSQRIMLVEGIRPILPLIRNTPYGKRIQSKLQREQMEGMGGQFGAYHHPSAQQAMVNLAMVNGMNPQLQQASQNHNLGQRGLHHAASMSDLYNGPSPMYSLGQPGMPSQRSQQQLHNQQLSAPGIDQYGSHLQTSPNASLLGGPQSAGGYAPVNVNGYSVNHAYGAPGGNLGLPAGELYAQHGGYNYM